MLLATLLVTVFGTTTAAAAFPENNIEFVVGYKPGGGFSD